MNKAIYTLDNLVKHVDFDFFELKRNGLKSLLVNIVQSNRFGTIYIEYGDLNSGIYIDLVAVLFLLNIKSDLYIKGRNFGYCKRFISLFRLFIAYLRILRALICSRPALINRCAEPKFTHGRAVYIKSTIQNGRKSGGSVGHTSGVANELANRFDLKFFSFEDTPLLSDRVHYDQFDDIQSTTAIYPFELNTVLHNQIMRTKVLSEVAGTEVDFIYQRLTLHNDVGAFVSSALSIPLVVEYNGSEVLVQERWGNRLLLREMAWNTEQSLLDQSARVVTVSDVLKDELLSRGVPSDKIIVYPNCIDEKVFDPSRFSVLQINEKRRNMGCEPDSFVFTFIGTFSRWHGIDFLVKSIHSLIKKKEEMLRVNRVRFIFVGSGPLYSYAQDALLTEESKPFVTFTGAVDQSEAPLYLALSDAFLSPHKKESGSFIGSPTKLFEYMAMGRFIIAADLDQISSVMSDCPPMQEVSDVGSFLSWPKAYGLRFTPGDENEFIKCIMFAVNNKEFIRKCGCYGRAKARAMYTWERHVDEFIQ